MAFAATSRFAVKVAINKRANFSLSLRQRQGVRSGIQPLQGITANACAAALELRVPEYRFVRRYLERSLQAPLSLRQVDPLIRELSQYRDLIQQRINFEETQS
jgi:hypothetical protein